jgi:CRISPR/Cas system endoribonuclease Cas6 (RAMP superfamily)
MIYKQTCQFGTETWRRRQEHLAFLPLQARLAKSDAHRVKFGVTVESVVGVLAEYGRYMVEDRHRVASAGKRTGPRNFL